MKKLMSAMLLSAALIAAPAHGQMIGPTPYLSASDSPFNPASFDYFYLEDVEDGAINTPGLQVTGPGICIAGISCFVNSGLTDSVGNGGNGMVGASIWTSGSTTVTFDAAILGSLPTAAGLVWTDGVNPITFQAFDQNDVLLGTIIGNHADGGFTGGTAEDNFYGATNAGGISRLVISVPSGLEIDHIQYGGFRISSAVPEPGTWAMMLTGFLMAGGVLRLRRGKLATA